MKVKLTEKQLQEVLVKLNQEFENNIAMQSCPVNSKWSRVRLFTKHHAFRGARRGVSGRRVPNACWHAYGRFIDIIFEIYPEAIVYTSGVRYTKNNWQWIDRDIGGSINPVYYSKVCNCEEV